MPDIFHSSFIFYDNTILQFEVKTANILANVHGEIVKKKCFFEIKSSNAIMHHTIYVFISDLNGWWLARYNKEVIHLRFTNQVCCL